MHKSPEKYFFDGSTAFILGLGTKSTKCDFYCFVLLYLFYVTKTELDWKWNSFDEMIKVFTWKSDEILKRFRHQRRFVTQFCSRCIYIINLCSHGIFLNLFNAPTHSSLAHTDTGWTKNWSEGIISTHLNIRYLLFAQIWHDTTISYINAKQSN